MAEAALDDRLPPALLVLTGVTGLVDAVSFLGLGHIFTANMTGNVVFLGFAAAGVSHPPLLQGGSPPMAPAWRGD